MNVIGLVLEAMNCPYDYGTQSDKAAPRTVDLEVLHKDRFPNSQEEIRPARQNSKPAGPPEAPANQPEMAGAEGLEPPTCGFGDRRSTN